MSEPDRRPCENCGEVAGPRYCPSCGQALESRRGPFLAVLREILSDWISLDSQFWRSLQALLRPGRLSERYVSGKRAPYLRPFRLYLVASLALFSTILSLEPPAAEGLGVYIAGELMGVEDDSDVELQLEFWNESSVVGRWMTRVAGDRIDRVRELPRQEVVDTLFLGLRRVLPLSLILFVPVLALVLKLLYLPIRPANRTRVPRVLYFDHLVFALHYQTALFFTLSATWLLTWLASVGLPASAIGYGLVALLMTLVYLPLALRRFYRQSWLLTAIKTAVLLFVYSQLLGHVVGLSTFVAIWPL